jgi:putative methionine-R-sulfoxide reductase with GAF domain
VGGAGPADEAGRWSDTRREAELRDLHLLHREPSGRRPGAAVVTYGVYMAARKPRGASLAAEQAARLAADRQSAARAVGQAADGDRPTTEADIRAAVSQTRDEIVAGRLAPGAVMDLVCRRTQFLTDAGGAVVELLEGAELVYRAASGSASRSLGLRVDTNRSLSGLCLRTAEAVSCDNADRDGRVDAAACRWVGIKSMVLVPVFQAGRAGGVLAAISAGVGAFGERDVRTLRLLADVLAEAFGPVGGGAGQGDRSGTT